MLQLDLRVKKQAQDRPMSMWISSIKQLEPVRHLLSPLLLDFMAAAWPSSISMVIPRGMVSPEVLVSTVLYRRRYNTRIVSITQALGWTSSV